MKNANEKKQLLVFGYGLPVICTLLVWRQCVKHGGLTLWAVIFAAAGLFVLILAILRSSWLKVVLSWWMKAARLIGSVLTVIILTVIYGIVFTPISFFLRLSGKDYMCRKKSMGRRSYWIARLPEESQQQTKQF
ncbi:MAG: hypothetical protein JW847_10155 [Candidatus Omnitrophica bacterium]|nr:hypothetical protein [Candidatus Omnitrophota bacterium]